MKLVLLAATLLFYTQVTETKECISYAITSKMKAYDKNACNGLEGEVASEDLLDSENEKKAIIEVYKHRVAGTSDDDLWIGVVSENESADPSESNPFVFFNGTQVEDANTLIKWRTKTGPSYSGLAKCVYLGVDGINTGSCAAASNHLCKVKIECEEKEEKCPMNNGFDRSRANLPVFALFMAGSVFKAFYALVGPAVM